MCCRWSLIHMMKGIFNRMLKYQVNDVYGPVVKRETVR